MTPEEQQRFEYLCKQIQIEKDQNKFDALVTELNELLTKKGMRLNETARKAS